MQRRFAIFNSDQLSKDGYSFSISALEDGIWQAAVYGVPSNLSHDVHRPIGWSYPKGLYFAPAKVLTLGYFLLAENETDSSNILRGRQSFFTHLLNSKIAPHAEKFKDALGDLYIAEGGNWFCSGVVLYGYDAIVGKAFPDLAAHIASDKDGLVNLDYLLQEFQYLTQGIFKKRNSDLTIIAHPYFRKSLSIYNNFHWIFLDELVSLNGQKDLRVKVKIEPDFLGFAPSFVASHEFEYWWGPKYNDDITAIHPGLTQYGSSEFEKLYSNIERTEFVWKKEDNLYTLELEEVRDEQAPTLTDTYACRYVHSIFDEKKNGFDHFDGAIRGYSTELMVERLERKMTDMGRRSEYTKLFRIDGNLSLSKWKSLVTNYLQGNPQIYEYFGLSKPDVQKTLEPKNPTPFEKYIPYSINQGDGIRLHVSYHENNKVQEHERFVSITDVVNLEEGKKDAIEYFTIELKKALNRLGTDLILPKDCVYFLPEDYYINIPCIFHSDSNNQRLLDDTLTALRNIVDGLVKRNNKEVISTTLAWNLEDKEVRLSVIGHVTDLQSWLNSFAFIPIERTAFKEWLTNQASFLRKNGRETICPVLSDLFHGDGVLYMKRRLVQEDATMSFPESEPNKYTIECESDKEDLLNSLRDGSIYAAPAMLIEKMICSKSGMDYFLSPYSMVLDDGVGQYMEKYRIASFHWTDKPRPIVFR